MLIRGKHALPFSILITQTSKFQVTKFQAAIIYKDAGLSDSRLTSSDSFILLLMIVKNISILVSLLAICLFVLRIIFYLFWLYNQEVLNYKIAARPERRRQFEKELTSQLEVALNILTACLAISELKEQVSSYCCFSIYCQLCAVFEIFELRFIDMVLWWCFHVNMSGSWGICFVASPKAWVHIFFLCFGL